MASSFHGWGQGWGRNAQADGFGGYEVIVHKVLHRRFLVLLQ